MHSVGFLMSCVVALVLVGCGRTSDLEMASIGGRVTYGGKPIVEGEIRFVPTGDTRGPTSAGAIENGSYKIVARGGVPVGSHRVEIRACRAAAGGKQHPGLPGDGATSKEQYLPKKYNDQSELTATIEPGRKQVTLDFDLPK
jgi:hypothetical protein